MSRPTSSPPDAAPLPEHSPIPGVPPVRAKVEPLCPAGTTGGGSPLAPPPTINNAQTRTGAEKKGEIIPGKKGSRKIYERIDGEGALEYQAFALFRDLGPKRTIAEIAREMHQDLANIRKWSLKNDWLIRSLAYDDYLDEIKRKRLERDKLEMAERQANLGRKMQDLADTALDMDGPNAIIPENVSDVVKLVETGVKIERQALGETTGAVDNRIVFQYNGPLPQWVPQTHSDLIEQRTIEGDEPTILDMPLPLLSPGPIDLTQVSDED